MNQRFFAASLAAATTAVEGIEGADMLCHAAMRMLSEGAPVPMERLAGELGWPLERLEGVLGRFPDAERDAAGALVGFALTLNPTPHAFEVDGRRLYTWCALDALFLPAILGKVAYVRSVCASTGAPVRMRVTPDRLDELEPEGALVSLVGACGPDNLRASFCKEVNFFASAAAAHEWGPAHPCVTIVTVAEAFEVGREFVGVGGARAVL